MRKYKENTMENNEILTLDPKEAGRECKKAVSRCHFSTVIYLLVASGLVVAIQTVLELVLGDVYVQLIESPVYSHYIVWGLQVLCMYILAFPLFHGLTKHLPRRDKTNKEKLTFGEFIGIFFATQGLMLVGSMIANVVNTAITEHFGIIVEDTTSEMIMGSPLWLIILVVVIIGPIFEELIFRKIYIDSIGKYSSGLAIFISGASFALFHGNITQAIYTFGAGILLAWVYTKTKKIIYPIIIHMLINFFGSIPSMLIIDSVNRVGGMTEEEIMAGVNDPTLAMDIIKVGLLGMMQYGFIIIGLIVLLSMLVRGKFRLDKTGEVRIPFFSRFRILVFNRGTLFFLIFSILTIVGNLFLLGM